jgi:hypothetical protein
MGAGFSAQNPPSFEQLQQMQALQAKVDSNPQLQGIRQQMEQSSAQMQGIGGIQGMGGTPGMPPQAGGMMPPQGMGMPQRQDMSTFGQQFQQTQQGMPPQGLGMLGSFDKFAPGQPGMPLPTGFDVGRPQRQDMSSLGQQFQQTQQGMPQQPGMMPPQAGNMPSNYYQQMMAGRPTSLPAALGTSQQGIGSVQTPGVVGGITSGMVNRALNNPAQQQPPQQQPAQPQAGAAPAGAPTKPTGIF